MRPATAPSNTLDNADCTKSYIHCTTWGGRGSACCVKRKAGRGAENVQARCGRGDGRRLDRESGFFFLTTEFLRSCNNSHAMPKAPIPDLLLNWNITAEELSEIVSENPSMRGLMFGFVAEYKLKKEWLLRRGITNLERPRSHDRKQKCDFRFDYRGINVRVEVKCLDTPKVRLKSHGVYEGAFQCNASDTTEVVLPNGRKVTTNCLVVDGFDILAVGLFAFENTWRSAFARNRDLPRTTWHKYTPAQQKYLLKSAMKISWPLQAPYVSDLFALLDGLVAEKVRR